MAYLRINGTVVFNTLAEIRRVIAVTTRTLTSLLSFGQMYSPRALIICLPVTFFASGRFELPLASPEVPGWKQVLTEHTLGSDWCGRKPASESKPICPCVCRNSLESL